MHDKTRPAGPIDLMAMQASIGAPYWNDWIAKINDHEVRMSIMTGEYAWHQHPDSDEVFLVLDGELVIEFETGTVTLGPGQLLTVERGILHRTKAGSARSVNLTFERLCVMTHSRPYVTSRHMWRLAASTEPTD